MGKSTELLSRGEAPSAIESPESRLERKRLKLEAQIFAVNYKDKQEGVESFSGRNEVKSGLAVERKIINDLKGLGILPLIEHAPVSVDEINGSSKVDIILMLPSGRTVGAQVYSAPEQYNKKGVEELVERSRNAINHGIKKLQRGGRQPSEVFSDFPMPVAVAAVDENKILEGDTNGCAREFLHNLAVGLSADVRRQMVEHQNPGAGIEELTNRWSRLNILELEPYFNEVMALEESLSGK